MYGPVCTVVWEGESCETFPLSRFAAQFFRPKKLTLAFFGEGAMNQGMLLEAGISVKYARVCTEDALPYSRSLEEEVLPNVKRIVDNSLKLLSEI